MKLEKNKRFDSDSDFSDQDKSLNKGSMEDQPANNLDKH